MNSLIIFFVILGVYTKIISCDPREFDCGMSQLDTKLSILTRSVSEITFSKTDAEITQMCRSTIKQMAFARKSTEKCTQGKSKSILMLISKLAQKTITKQLCKNKPARKRLIGASTCLNSGKNASKCWTKMVSAVTLAINSSDHAKRVPLFCCSLLRWKDCFLSVYEELRGTVCNPDHFEYIEERFNTDFVGQTKILCADYDLTDKCDKYETILTSLESTKVSYITPFPAILTLSESLWNPSPPTPDITPKEPSSSSQISNYLVTFMIALFIVFKVIFI